MSPKNYGFVVRWLPNSEGRTVRARTEAGFSTHREADLALEKVLVHLERASNQDCLVVESFVALFNWSGTVVESIAEDE